MKVGTRRHSIKGNTMGWVEGRTKGQHVEGIGSVQ